MSPTTPAERWGPLAAGALLALPVLLAPYPPMMDLPLHEATVSILRHRGDAAMFPPGLYFVNLGHPNQLFHLAAWALSYVVSTSLAARLVIAAGVIGLPLAAARLADHLGAARWTAVVVAPIALGWIFIFGLVANLLGLVAFVAALPALDRFVERPSLAGAARAAGAVVVLYFAHEVMLFLYMGTALFFAVFHAPRTRESWLRVAPVAFAAALVAAQQRYQAPLFTKAVKSVPTTYLPLDRKIGDLPLVLFAPFAGLESTILLLLAIVATAALAWPRLREVRAPNRAPAASRGAWCHAHRFELLAALCFLGYLAGPHSIHGANLMHQRLLAPAYVLAVVALTRRTRAESSPSPRLAPLLASLPALGIVLVTWPAFVASSRDHADVARLSQRIDRGSALATIEMTQDDPDSVDVLKQPMAMVALSERGGRYLYSFAESPISPVMIRPEWRWDEPVDRILTRSQGWCPRYDFTRFRYVLLYSPNAALQLVATGAMLPEGRYVARAGFWVLYESTLPVVPLTSPDGPGPADDCHGDNLTARIHRVQADLLARARAGAPLPELPPE